MVDPNLFSSLTIINGINVLRGYGHIGGWPDWLSRLLFNKVDALIVGFVHWLSYFQLSDHFGGVFKFLIIPFGLGVITLIRYPNKLINYLLLGILIITLPGILFYPEKLLLIYILSSLFSGIITLVGLVMMPRKITVVILLLTILEVVLKVI